eukprot:2122344-Pyramimonas_sp.AAC.1
MCRRAKRLRRLSGVLGRKTLRVFSSGPLAGGPYGADIVGVSDHDLLLMRRQAFSTVRPFSQGR